MTAESTPRGPGATFSKNVRHAGDILLIEARFYEDVGEALLDGAQAELEAHGIGYDHVTVPGALEIPQALAQAIAAQHSSGRKFAGAVALGCVIRGETGHYDIVCNNANHWLMDVALKANMPVGNAILTVENRAQAMARAEGGRNGKGAEAVRACLSLIELAQSWHAQSRHGANA